MHTWASNQIGHFNRGWPHNGRVNQM
jgi:hypothetical protein